jgi:hypothetical protein
VQQNVQPSMEDLQQVTHIRKITNAQKKYQSESHSGFLHWFQKLPAQNEGLDVLKRNPYQVSCELACLTVDLSCKISDSFTCKYNCVKGNGIYLTRFGIM